ncbi:IS110 family transposase, partial [Klebsiella quasipneumoniae]
MVDKVTEAAVVGGVDTHKDLHVAAVVDQNHKVLGTQDFSPPRHGSRR